MASASGEGKEAHASMSRAEAEGIFHLFDSDKSGTIEMSELRELAFAMGVTLSDSGLEAAFEVLDADKSGTIDFEEFYTWLTSASSDEDASTMLQLEMQARLMGRQALQVARSFLSTSEPTDDSVASFKFTAATNPPPSPEAVGNSIEAKVSPGDEALRASQALPDEKATLEVVFSLRATVIPEQAQAWVENLNRQIEEALNMLPIPPGILSRVAFTLNLTPAEGPPTLALGVYASEDPIAFAIGMARDFGALPPGAESIVDLLGERGLALLSKAVFVSHSTRSTLESLGLVEADLSVPGTSSTLCSAELSRTFLRQLISAITEASASLPGRIARDAKHGIAFLRAVEALTHVEVEMEMDAKRSQGLLGAVVAMAQAIVRMPGMDLPPQFVEALRNISAASALPGAGAVTTRGQILSALGSKHDAAMLTSPELVDIFKAALGNDSTLLPGADTLIEGVEIGGGPPGPQERRFVAWHAAWFLLNVSGITGSTLATESIGAATHIVGGQFDGVIDEALAGVQAWAAAEFFDSGPRAAMTPGGAEPPGIAVMTSYMGWTSRMQRLCNKWAPTPVMSRLGPVPFNAIPDRHIGPDSPEERLERGVGEASDLGQALSAAGGHSPYAVVAGVLLVVDATTPEGVANGKAFLDAFLEGAAGTPRPLVVVAVTETGGAFDEGAFVNELGSGAAADRGAVASATVVRVNRLGTNLGVAMLALEHAIADSVGPEWKQGLQEGDLAAAL